ncbi:hypothetical protein LSTR_LSTR015773 [Laodelphax striatellus]|uniref:Uncharacterized protein n=1 Tax=Laodelphax striatellus TaxID=195883 RepID=A0A482WZN8_LAOST|nr:hypothetical protein LSTR_LSTR015773 [Laodelphax striatellus]
MQGWVGFSRILALVEREGNHALFILLSARMPPDTFTDLSIERVIAIDSDFRCDVDDASKHQDGNDIFVNVTSKKIKLLFEMVPGSKTSDFVSNLFRATDQVGKKRGGFPEFHWLSKYNSGSAQPHDEKEEIGSESLLLDSPELAVPRQSIAKGATPIAARESVIRYQMAMKEDDYTITEVIRVFVGTWNVNGQAPGASLADWLASDVEPPDIYAIGFQELDLSKEAFLFNDTPREDELESPQHNGSTSSTNCQFC